VRAASAPARTSQTPHATGMLDAVAATATAAAPRKAATRVADSRAAGVLDAATATETGGSTAGSATESSADDAVLGCSGAHDVQRRYRADSQVHCIRASASHLRLH
jgi:hypothetical protein